VHSLLFLGNAGISVRYEKKYLELRTISSFANCEFPPPPCCSSIDIGNDGSAFVEVLVGRAEGGKRDGDDDGYSALLPASSFMSPIESRNAEMSNRVRIFAREKLNQTAAAQRWDRVKVVCTQPFNTKTKYCNLNVLK
jgi:DNA-repair protein XRCC1